MSDVAKNVHDAVTIFIQDLSFVAINLMFLVPYVHYRLFVHVHPSFM